MHAAAPHGARQCGESCCVDFSSRRGGARTRRTRAFAVPRQVRRSDLRTGPQGGDSALSNAAFYGHLESVRILLDRGANMETKNNVRARGGGAPPPRGARRVSPLRPLRLQCLALQELSRYGAPPLRRTGTRRCTGRCATSAWRSCGCCWRVEQTRTPRTTCVPAPAVARPAVLTSDARALRVLSRHARRREKRRSSAPSPTSCVLCWPQAPPRRRPRLLARLSRLSARRTRTCS